VGAIFFGPTVAGWLRGPDQADLDYVPRDASMFISFRVADLWTSHMETPKDLPEKEEKAFAEARDKQAKEFRDRLGVDPTDVERISVAISQIDEPISKMLAPKPSGPENQPKFGGPDMSKMRDKMKGFPDMSKMRDKMKGFPDMSKMADKMKGFPDM